jgi:hypothetical protein
MPSQHIVVDGSNIATEGRSAPSLAQLEQAVSELRREFSDAEVTVIVDATFAHRIDPSELERFERAAQEGEYVHPPAGAIGRGDAFLLRIAEKVDAIVLSNDSFQEFHGEHPWLFERGRLLGATPVPGVGWIFSPRTPVRGPRSRRAVKDSDRERRKVSRAIEVATKEVVSGPHTGGREPSRRRTKAAAAAVDGSAPDAEATSGRQRRQAAPAAVNDPLTFISFIAEHALGEEVTARVDSYTSHGAVAFIGNLQAYVPLANMADPPPRSAREVLKRGEERLFVVKALDPLRRGVELALPGIAPVSGRPSDEMIAAEVRIAKKASSPRRTRSPGTAVAATSTKKAGSADEPPPSAAATAVARPPAKRSAAKKAGPADTAPPRQAPAPSKAAGAGGAKAASKKALAAAAPASGTASAKRAPATKAAPTRAVAKKAPASTAASAAKAAPAKRAPAAKKAAQGHAGPTNTAGERPAEPREKATTVAGKRAKSTSAEPAGGAPPEPAPRRSRSRATVTR